MAKGFAQLQKPGRPTQQFTKIRRPTGTDTGILVFDALKPFNLKI